MPNGELTFSLEALIGCTVERVHRVPAELPRSVKEYAVIECADRRVMIAFCEVTSAAPDSLVTHREAAKEHGAFTVRESLMRHEGEPFNRPTVVEVEVDEELLIGDSDDSYDSDAA